MIYWHRLLGVSLIELFKDSCFEVEMEKDLSIKKQFLDLVILRKKEGEFKGTLPDGFDSLADYNVITFKSIHEPLDDWAIEELISHYVNYRKIVSEPLNILEPKSKFRLYAIGTRFPQNLSKMVDLKQDQWKGVYNIDNGISKVNVIVLSEIEKKEHNSLWLLFSGEPDKVSYGASNWQIHKTEEVKAILNQLLTNYEMEGLNMPYTMEQFKRDAAMEYLNLLSPEVRLEGLSPEVRLEGLSPDQVLNKFSPEDRLNGLSLETIMNYLSKIEKN